jgi:hypothetical protein
MPSQKENYALSKLEVALRLNQAVFDDVVADGHRALSVRAVQNAMNLVNFPALQAIIRPIREVDHYRTAPFLNDVILHCLDGDEEKDVSSKGQARAAAIATLYMNAVATTRKEREEELAFAREKRLFKIAAAIESFEERNAQPSGRSSNQHVVRRSTKGNAPAVA